VLRAVDVAFGESVVVFGYWVLGSGWSGVTVPTQRRSSKFTLGGAKVFSDIDPPALIVLAGISALVAFGLTAHATRRRAAVGRSEIRMLLMVS
jgi:hypothetical protein